jgi:hypothetical protein
LPRILNGLVNGAVEDQRDIAAWTTRTPGS